MLTNEMSMPLENTEWRSASLKASPEIMVTFGRAASSSAGAEVVERVRTRTLYLESLVSSDLL